VLSHCVGHARIVEGSRHGIAGSQVNQHERDGGDQSDDAQGRKGSPKGECDQTYNAAVSRRTPSTT
jgi:hypothetical protein